MKGIKWSAVYGAALALFTLFLALQTFVLPSGQTQDAGRIDTSIFDAPVPEKTDPAPQTNPEPQTDPVLPEEPRPDYPIVTDTSYEDEHFKIVITAEVYEDTTVYTADITMDSAVYLKTAMAYDTFGRNIKATTSANAKDHNAILAINGDYYGARESGIVIRNGVLYRSKADTADLLCIYADGNFKIYKAGERTAEELMEEKVWQCFAFGPGLVSGGEVMVSDGQEVRHAMASNPRTAIGLVDDLHYIFVVSDGRTAKSAGLSLEQLAAYMKDKGCRTAYNLDGGGSSTMWFNGSLVNMPTSTGRTVSERSISDIVYIG